MILDGLVKGIYDMFSFDNKNTMLEKHDFSLFGGQSLIVNWNSRSPCGLDLSFLQVQSGSWNPFRRFNGGHFRVGDFENILLRTI